MYWRQDPGPTHPELTAAFQTQLTALRLGLEGARDLTASSRTPRTAAAGKYGGREEGDSPECPRRPRWLPVEAKALLRVPEVGPGHCASRGFRRDPGSELSRERSSQAGWFNRFLWYFPGGESVYLRCPRTSVTPAPLHPYLFSSSSFPSVPFDFPN